MAVDGTYNIETTTPRGTQTSKLTLKSDGKTLSGSLEGPRGTQAFSGGTVSGNDVAWSVTVSSPMGSMKIDYKGTVKGNEISGTVQMGQFGSAPFKGKKV